MEVTNNTDTDAKYKVSSGTQGSGMGPHKPFEDAGNWPTLPAGGRVQHHPKSPGPWVVYFVVKGEEFSKNVHPDTERVALVANGGRFRVDSN